MDVLPVHYIEKVGRSEYADRVVIEIKIESDCNSRVGLRIGRDCGQEWFEPSANAANKARAMRWGSVVHGSESVSQVSDNARVAFPRSVRGAHGESLSLR